MDMVNVMNSLILMGKGMTAIFVVTIVIFLIVTLLIKFTPNNSKSDK
ncbi:MAG: hypothetical protein K0S71_2038 [Clostridia bacterium]|jgi:hypothetical protein|nr:hypothetical protein [Clostridia bacterium]